MSALKNKVGKTIEHDNVGGAVLLYRVFREGPEQRV